MDRVSKINYYLDIAQTVAERATCLRRKFGAIVVKNDSIVSTGYNGAPRGRKNCTDLGYCKRENLNIPRGERYELCRSVHAEQNAIINAAREQMIDADMYLCCVNPENNEVITNVNSCMMCKRMIINAGIKTVYIRDKNNHYSTIKVEDWIQNDDSLNNNLGY